MAISLRYGCMLEGYVLRVHPGADCFLLTCPLFLPIFLQGNTPPVVVNTDTLDGSPYVRIRSNLLFIVWQCYQREHEKLPLCSACFISLSSCFGSSKLARAHCLNLHDNSNCADPLLIKTTSVSLMSLWWRGGARFTAKLLKDSSFNMKAACFHEFWIHENTAF